MFKGEAISEADATAILASDDLIAVGMMGDDVRRSLHGARTTFVRVFEVHVDAPPSSAPAGFDPGEVRIVGRPASVDAALAAVSAAAAVARETPVSGFSLHHIAALATAARPLQDICAALRSAGLSLLSEVALDRSDDDAARDVETARKAGLLVTRLVVEELRTGEAIPMAARARDMQARVGGFRAFAPLPRTTSVATPSTGYDDVKQVAVARMLAANIPSIQVDWVLYGPKLAQVALTVGADDVDGVAAVETGALGTRRSALQEIRGNIRAAALDPIERNALWEERPA